MINETEIKEKYPRSFALLQNFLVQNAIEYITPSTYIYFLDSHSIYVGVTTIEGSDWLVEICGIVIDICNTRVEAESLGIAEGLEILEKTL